MSGASVQSGSGFALDVDHLPRSTVRDVGTTCASDAP
jgi:hypothetical protein